jgi:hypothetical protein
MQVRDLPDGLLLAKFRASGRLEMDWHLSSDAMEVVESMPLQKRES